MHNGQIRIVVFDLGRVMIHIAGGWEEACRYAGVPYRPFDMTREKYAEFLRLEDDLESDRIDIDAFAEGLVDVSHGLYTPQELQAMYLGIIQAESPGIYETVGDLQAAGIATACLSNTCAPHWAEFMKTERYPAICRLDHPTASHLFGVRKPKPEIYQAFEAAVGYRPAEILFFDDKGENIDAAHARGWHAVTITPDRPSVEQIRETVVAYGINLVEKADTHL